ncbi:MAG TPA: hypothetical protein VLG47_01570 [Candidatus Saccharimonadales bacterium]|nr:hypothetical protein [Candidatus Saccharimonadales bacterium]
MANTTQKSQVKSSNKPSEPSHKARTFFSALLGTVAVYLILMSITVVWLNRTLTDTNTYVATVGPLVSKPEIQNYVADKVTDQILQNAPTVDLAKKLLPAKVVQLAPAPEQLKAALQPIIRQNVLQVVQSQQFAQLWQSTNQSAHAALVTQLNSNNVSAISLDLSPAITGVVAQLKTTQLKPIADQIKVKSDTGKLDIKNDKIKRIHYFYHLFKEGTIVLILLAILLAASAIWLSTHHGKTARRILFGVGILSLLQAAILAAPSYATISGTNAADQAAAKTIAQALFHNLQVASLVIGLVCIVIAIGWKLFAKFKH